MNYPQEAAGALYGNTLQGGIEDAIHHLELGLGILALAGWVHDTQREADILAHVFQDEQTPVTDLGTPLLVNYDSQQMLAAAIAQLRHLELAYGHPYPNFVEIPDDSLSFGLERVIMSSGMPGLSAVEMLLERFPGRDARLLRFTIMPPDETAA